MDTEVIASTENFLAVLVNDPDGEQIFDLDLNLNVTIHFFIEEWEEFCDLANQFVNAPSDKEGVIAETDNYYVGKEEINGDMEYYLEIPGATLYYTPEDWKEVCELMQMVINKQ